MIKNNKIKELLLVTSLFLIYVIFSLRVVLTSDGTIGHLLDWWIPSETSELQQMFYKSQYIWRDLFLGYNQNFAVVNSFNMFFGTFGMLGFSGAFVSKSYIVVILALSGITMYFLLKHLLKIKEENTILHIPCLLGSLFYFMNPLVINQLVGGAGLYLMAYSLSPLFFLLFLKSLDNNKIKWKYGISAAILYTIIGIDNHFLGFLILISALYILFNKHKLQRIKILIIIITLGIILNLYWIINFIVYYNVNTMFLPVAGEDKSNMAGMLLHSSPLFSVFNFSFNFNINLYKYLMEPNLYPLFQFSSYVLLIFILSSLLIINPKTKRLVLYLFTTILIGIFFSKGLGSPFGFINEWLYINFTPMFLYRTFHHIPFLIVFPYSILVSLNFNFLKNNFRKAYPHAILIFIILFIIFVNPSLYGDFKGGVLTFREPNSVIEIKNMMNSFDKSTVQTDYRIAYLPLAGSVWSEGTPTDLGPGGSFQTVLWSEKPTFVADISSGNPKKISETIEKSLYENKTTEFGRLLALTNTKYIILRSDIKHIHVPYGRAFWWNNPDPYKIAFDLLSHQSGIKFIKEINRTSLWENTNNLDHIYVAEDIFFIDSDIGTLPAIGNVGLLNNKPAIFFKDQLSKKDINRLERLDRIIEMNKTIINKKNQNNYMPIIIKNSALIADENTSKYPISWSFDRIGEDTSSIMEKENYITIKKTNDIGLSCLKQENVAIKDNRFYSASIFIKSDKNNSENFQFQLNWRDRNNSDLGNDVVLFDIKTDLKRIKMQGFSKNASSVTIYLCNRKINTLYLKNVQLEEGTDMTDYFEDYSKDNLRNDLDSAAGKLINYSNTGPTKENNKTILNFTKINPTNYEVSVKTKSEGYFLIFSETFNSEWVAVINDKKINEHYLVNGFANSWYINNSQFCNDSNIKDNICNYNISLIYTPQNLYNYSLAISIFSFLFLVFILLIAYKRNF